MSNDADIADIAEELPPEPLPLDGWHRARGARMVPFAGYSMPIQYGGIIAEHHWTRGHAGLFDVSHMGQVVVTGTDGADAATALEALLPGDIVGLKPGRMRYSMLLDDDGGILDDLMAARLSAPNPFDADEAAIHLVVNGARKWDDIAWMREHLADEITINLLDERALLALQGPAAAAALARLVPDAAGLYFMQAAGFDWQGQALWISRSGYTGEDGFEISVAADAAEALAEALCAEPEVQPAGLGARDSLRLEAGLPLYGHDLDTGTGPVGAGLGFAIAARRRAAGGYPGHARVARELAGGAPARWVGLTIEDRLPAREGAAILDGERRVGTVTSGGFSPSLGAPIAMGWIEAPLAAVGTALTIDVRGRALAATVAATPFVPHRYHRAPSPKTGVTP